MTPDQADRWGRFLVSTANATTDSLHLIKNHKETPMTTQHTAPAVTALLKTLRQVAGNVLYDPQQITAAARELAAQLEEYPMSKETLDAALLAALSDSDPTP